MPQFNIRNVLGSADPGSGEESPSVGSRGEASVGSLGDLKAGGRFHSQSSGLHILVGQTPHYTRQYLVNAVSISYFRYCPLSNKSCVAKLTNKWRPVSLSPKC